MSRTTMMTVSQSTNLMTLEISPVMLANIYLIDISDVLLLWLPIHGS